MEFVEQKVFDFLEEGIAHKVFSGAQAAWCRAGDPSPVVVCAGSTQTSGLIPVEAQTCFDIASLTKVFLASAVLRLVAKGELALHDNFASHAPDLSTLPQKDATLAELLAHEAGYVSWLPLFEQVPLAQRGTPFAKEQIVSQALNAPDNGAPGEGTVYSDLGYIVLAHMVETFKGQSLDRIIMTEVTAPLGLNSVHFRPIEERNTAHKTGLKPNPAIPVVSTEHCPWRGRLLTGEVHDDNAWSMGGISGHAGLFATAPDVARLGETWLQSCARDGWLSKPLALEAIRRRSSGRGLGWDLVSPKGSSAGSLFSPRAFGHLGFTGCSLWVDPDRDLSVALNTNRVHYGRDNPAIREFRPAFHDLLVASL